MVDFHHFGLRSGSVPCLQLAGNFPFSAARGEECSGDLFDDSNDGVEKNFEKSWNGTVGRFGKDIFFQLFFFL